MNGNTNLLMGTVVPMPRRPGRSRANGITEPFDHFGYWNLMPDEEALKQATVRNILNSYQGSYDLFIEAVQNAVDALEHRVKLVWSGEDIELTDDPELWVILNLRESEVTVVDSGLGLCKSDVMQILVPNLSLKHHLAGALGLNLRGHLGVGATFLAHATDYIRISTVGDDGYLSFELAGGRNWVMGDGNHKQPAARPATETCAEFNALGRGTAVTLRLGEGTRPAALSHLAATTKKWEAILRTKTAIGFVDLLGREKWNKQVKVNLSLVDGTGSRISSETPFLYPLPHTIGTLNSLNMNTYYQEHREGDTVAKKHLGQDALYRVWTKRQLFHPQKGILNKEECPHLHGKLEGAYTFFAFSASLFGLLSELEVGDRTLKVIKPGAWVVAQNAVVGEPIPLELAFASGNEDRFFMLVQLSDVRPDLGRKGFDPELKEEIRKLGDAAIRYFVVRRKHLRPAGTQASQAADRMAQHQRIREAEARVEKTPLGGGYSLRSLPQHEPEVIGLFFQLCGRRDIVGYRVYGAYHSATYDGVFDFRLEKSHPKALYNPDTNPLGLPPGAFARREAVEHPPSMLEFKVSLDSLIEEVSDSRSPKKFESLALVIVWDVGRKWGRNFDLTDLAEEGVVGSRELFGATHILSRKGIEEGHSVAIIELKKVVELIASIG